MDQEPHRDDGDERDHGAPEGRLGLVALIKIDHGHGRESRRQDIEAAAGYAERGPLEMIGGFPLVPLNPPDHVPDADAGGDLDERIQPESEERDVLVLKPEEDRDQPFANIIEDGDQREHRGPFVESGVLW